MTAKRIPKRMKHPRHDGAGPTEAAQRVIEATQRLAAGNATREDWDIFLSDLVASVGLYDPPSFAEYTLKTQKPEAFPIHAAMHAASCAVVAKILKAANMDEEALIRLEGAVIAEKAARGRG